MTPNEVKTVVDNLDDFIEIPGGTERLRKAVLTLAVSGKLVPQDPKEGTAEELYKKTQVERIKSEKNGNGNKKKTLENLDVAPSEIPFEIPKTWKWVRLGSVFVDYGSGSTPSRSNSSYYNGGNTNWYKSGEMNDGILSADAEEKITNNALAECHLRLNKQGDFCIAMYGATAGRIAMLNNKGTTNQAVWCGTPDNSVIIQYLFYYILQSRIELLKTSSGAAQPNISGEKIAVHVLPLPPLAEQKRIVKKVDEVMKQLDSLEAKKQERDEVRARLTRSAMQSLGKGESKIAFDQLVELIKTPTDIKELEGALLNLAVSGKLVPQDPSEGTAEELYKNIKTERINVGWGKKKKEKMLPEMTSAEIPFKIPESWKWVKLNDIGDTNIGLTYSPDNVSDVGIPVLRSTNVQNGQIDLTELVRVEKEIKSSVLVEEGDLLICARNGSKALVGKTAMIHKLDEKMAFGAFMAVFRSVCNPYVEVFLKSPIFRNLLEGVNTTTINQITQENLKNTLIPLPPFEEQKRIVKKVEEVMNLVNQLRLVIGESRTQKSGRFKK